MKKVSIIKRLCTLLIFIGSCFAYMVRGQEDVSAYYNWFDQTIGRTNSGIYNGIAYRELYGASKERHKFFLKPNFIAGRVVYDRQPFYGIDLLYDVFGDELLVRYIGLNGSAIVQLIKARVGSFEIAGHCFANMDLNSGHEPTLSGFYEILFEGKWFVFYKKHLKKIIRKSDKESIYYAFADKQIYYIKQNGIFHEVSSVRDLFNAFPENKSALQQFNDRYKELRKLAQDQYFMAVLKDLEGLLSVTQKVKEP